MRQQGHAVFRAIAAVLAAVVLLMGMISVSEHAFHDSHGSLWNELFGDGLNPLLSDGRVERQ